MRILGIETSCDETAVCLIEAGSDLPRVDAGKAGFGPSFKWKTLGNALISQAAMHAEFGGVFPNLAKREHAKNLVPLLVQALKSEPSSATETSFEADKLAKLLEREPELLAQLVPFLEKNGKPDIDAIAVTYGPGLEPALWVGINFAKALSLAWDVPIVAVNHMEGHIVMSLMSHPDTSQKSKVSGCEMESFEFPILALLISGGHTELVLSKEFGQYELIGQTRDDAAGEAFDKVARLLGLGYPGGPEISRLAAEARSLGLAANFKLPRPMQNEDTFDFSFSGLKTAVRRLVDGKELSEDEKKKIAREFEDAVADVLVAKTLRAVEELGAATVVVGGGVSANTYIRARLAEALEKDNNLAKLLIPPPELATDNALMIGLAGYFHALKKEFADPATLSAKGNLQLTT